MEKAVNYRIGRLVLAAQPHLGIPALYVHNLTGTPDAERLLSKPPRINPVTSEILPRLRQFSPEIAAKLVEKDDAVRQIPFSLITTNQFWIPRDIQSFVALSYCWHGTDWEVPSRCNVHQLNWDFPISPAMLNAVLLRGIVHSGTTSRIAMWIDQICIDQENSEEKSHLIANLDTIYQNAFEVNILLEDVDISSEEESALSLSHTGEYGSSLYNSIHLEGLDIEKSIRNCLNAGYGTSLASIMVKVYKSRWFTRAWCRHEYMLNSSAVFFLFGRRLASITLDPGFFRELKFQLGLNGVDMNELHLDPAYQDFTFGINDRNTDYTTKGCLFELFVQLQRLSCSYERDIISISLNASGIRLSFNGDVRRQRDCRHILAMIALGARDASVLGGEGFPMYRMNCPGHQPFICWPREYESDWSFFTAKSMPKICDDARIWYVTPERISLDIFFLFSRPSMPPREFRESAIELSSLLEHKNEIYNTDILSCAFAFGLRWIDTVSGYLKDQLVKYFAADDIPHQAIMSVVTRYCPSSEASSTTQGILNQFRIAQFMYFLASCDRYFAHIDETTPLAVRLNSVGRGRAILLVPKYLAREVCSGKYRIAMPVALNTMEALGVRRIWILEFAKTDEPAFVLVGRGFFIGEGALNTDEHNEVCYARQVTVVGQWRDDLFSQDDSSSGEGDNDRSQEISPTSIPAAI